MQPRTELAAAAGIKLSQGILIDPFLETSAPGVFAAGDIARWPDPFSETKIRVEHWVVAERQGPTAARNILGQKERFDAVPFLWTRQFDFTLHYHGHAEEWDQILMDGSIEKYDCTLEFERDTKSSAIATIGRDLESLKVERYLEQRFTKH